jgi:hypothetical protein
MLVDQPLVVVGGTREFVAQEARAQTSVTSAPVHGTR